MVGIDKDLEGDLKKDPYPRFVRRAQKVPPRRRDPRSASKDRGRSRSPSTPRICPDAMWKRIRAMPVEHSRFIWDIVSYISNLQASFDFAVGCGIPSHIVRKAIEDNDPSDGDISLEEYVVQALTVWWLSTNRPAIWKSEKIRVLLNYICLEFMLVL